ncbi:hypothetical protein Tco_1058920 [Tanacetum coccineum]
MQGPWLLAVIYLHGEGLTVSDCLGDMKKNCIKGKLELVVGVVKSSPNSLGDMTVTLKDPIGFLVLLKLMLLVMIITAAAYVSTAGEDCWNTLMLNPCEFELWKIRIEQYFLMTDYALWEVILNGDSPLPTRTVDGVETSVPPTTAEQKLARKNELKIRGTLLMALPNEHQLKFNT